MAEQQLCEYDFDADLAGCWNTLIDHARERHIAGEMTHPAWLSRDAGYSVSLTFRPKDERE